jgi:hypothetical protein
MAPEKIPAAADQTVPLLLEVSSFPELSTATHSPVEKQETELIAVEPSIELTLQAPAPPVGLVEVTTLPALSTAAQKVVDEQETAATVFEPSTVSTVQLLLDRSVL